MKAPWNLGTGLVLSALLAGTAFSLDKAPDIRWLTKVSNPTNIKIDGRSIPFYDHSYALIISESNYTEDQGWIHLSNDRAEADTVAKALQAQGFAVERATDLTGAQLRSALNDFVKNYGGEDSRLVIFYAGHGYTDGLHGYLVPIDGVSSRTNLAELTRRSLSTAELLAIAGKAKARHVLFLLDSCFSAALFQSRHGFEPPSRLEIEGAALSARQFLTSTREDQPAPAVSNFVPAIVQGINGAADLDGDGIVSGTELAVWTRKVVARANVNPTNPVYGDIQSHGGDMLFIPSTASGPAPPLKKTFQTAKELGPSEAPKAVFKGLDVYYYRKAADGLALETKLESAKIPFVSSASTNPQNLRTNTIACSRAANIESVKILARTMMGAGFPLYEIQRFHKHPDKSERRVELLNSAKYDRSPNARPLTAEQISSMTECPDILSNQGPQHGR